MSQSLLLQRLRGHGLLVPSMKKATSESHGSRKRAQTMRMRMLQSPNLESVVNIKRLEAEMVTFPPQSRFAFGPLI